MPYRTFKLFFQEEDETNIWYEEIKKIIGRKHPNFQTIQSKLKKLFISTQNESLKQSRITFIKFKYRRNIDSINEIQNEVNSLINKKNILQNN